MTFFLNQWFIIQYIEANVYPDESLTLDFLPFYRDKVLTGSFDKTAKLWSAESGKCFHTYRGHTSEIVSPY